MSSSIRLFDNISKIYGLFFNFQVAYYTKILGRVKTEFDITDYDTVLDVGCGTGALSHILDDNGLKVTGVDTSQGMLNQANKKLKNKDIELIRIVPGEKLPFPDNSFDIAISTYVAHGLKPKDRIEFYKEMKRVSKEYIVLHDYNETRGLLTTIIEWLEKGDYFNFIKVAKDELGEIFEEFSVVDVDTRAAWYICKSNK